jgi:hypothetical protein
MMSQLLARRPAKVLAVTLAALLCTPGVVLAQAPGAEDKPFSQEELEQLAAPIALHPDQLVAQILMASTYPLEVVQAARFVKANPALKEDQLQEALKKQDWDDSVKTLTLFPPVLEMMNEKLEWTQKLGDAFLAQQKELMDSIQRLRAKAQASGNLKDSKEQKVIVEPAPAPAAGQTTQQTTVIKIEPANPQTVYVPTYNPTVVYGAWPYPAYPPYAYYPPGYAFAGAALSFGAGMFMGAAMAGAWGWGGCNWGGGEVDIDVNKNNNFSKNVNRGDVANKRAERQAQGGGKFQHNPEHRKGAQYRDSGTQQRFNKSGPANSQAREQFRGRAEQGRQDLARGGQQGGLGDRGGAGQGGPGDRGGAGRGGAGDRGGAGGGQGFGDRGGADRGGAGGGARGSAFEGAGGGAGARADSARGNASRDSMGASRGGGSRSANIGSGGGRSGGGSSFSGGGGGSRGGGGFSGGGGSRGGGGGGRGGGGGGRR